MKLRNIIRITALFLIFGYVLIYSIEYLQACIKKSNRQPIEESLVLHRNKDPMAIKNGQNLNDFTSDTSNQIIWHLTDGVMPFLDTYKISNLPETIPDLLLPYEDSIALYAKLIKASPMAYPFEDTITRSGYIPRLPFHMYATRLLHLKVRWLLKNGEFKNALETTRLILEIGTKLDMLEGPTILTLLGNSVKDQGAKAAADCIKFIPETFPVSFSDLSSDLLTARLQDTGIINSLVYDYEQDKNLLMHIKTAPPLIIFTVGEHPKEKAEYGWWQRFHMYLYYDADETINWTRNDMASIIEAAKLPFFMVDTSYLPEYRKKPEMMSEGYNGLFGFLRIKWNYPTNYMGRTWYWSTHGVLLRYERMLMYRASINARLNITYIACKLHDQKVLPITLRDLKLSQSVLINPLTGQQPEYVPKKRSISTFLMENEKYEVSF